MRGMRIMGIFHLAIASTLVLACGGYEPVEGDEELELDEAKADSASVSVKTDGSSYMPTVPISTAVTNKHQHTIYLPGCNPVSLQRLDNGSWKNLPPEMACFWEGYAQQVKSTTTFNIQVTPKPKGTYRVKVLYKTSCAGQTPFSGCKASVRTVYSSKFVVKDECWGAWLDQNGKCRTPADGVYPMECCKALCAGTLETELDYRDSTDGKQCEVKKSYCVTKSWSKCPQLSPLPPNWCTGGKVVQGAPSYLATTDGEFCKMPSVHCVTNDWSKCPLLSPLPPGYCSDGTLKAGAPSFVPSVDGKECQIPSMHCLSNDPAACLSR